MIKNYPKIVLRNMKHMLPNIIRKKLEGTSNKILGIQGELLFLSKKLKKAIARKNAQNL